MHHKYKMSRRIERNIQLLKIIAKPKAKKQREALLDRNQDLLEALLEIVDNILKGNLRIAADHKQQLRKYKKLLYSLASRKVPLKHKRNHSMVAF